MSPRVLHVIQGLSRGGAARALLTAAASVNGFEHRVLSLQPAAAETAARARSSGLELVEDPTAERAMEELAAADIVHVHFWNTPELYELLARGMPPARLLLWSHVGGDHAPHVLTRDLVAFADTIIATAAHSLELSALRDAAPSVKLIASTADLGRLAGVRRVPHRGFNVGYMGTVDFVKMHPRYVEMSAAVDVPGANFIVCGLGAGFSALERRARELAVEDRFDLRGYVRDIRQVIAALDVFGYPLRERNYSTSELVLQEVMYAGVPPVVLPYGGAGRVVSDGRTGLVAADENEYPRAIERLYRSPALRQRLGRAAREHALRAWSPREVGARWRSTYGELLATPKRPRPAAPLPAVAGAGQGAHGAARFVGSLGARAPQFARSLSASEIDEVLDAEHAIAQSPSPLASADSGGVLHYRRHHPRDRFLRLWAGLVFLGQGRAVLAAAEFSAAIELGFDHWRASWYLARAARAVGQQTLAEEALRRVPASAAPLLREVGEPLEV